MKKLITVCWSNTVEVDIPDEYEHLGGAELQDFLAHGQSLELVGARAICEAFENISAKCGEITDVQDAE